MTDGNSYDYMHRKLVVKPTRSLNKKIMLQVGNVYVLLADLLFDPREF